jgi:hypothetical protein
MLWNPRSIEKKNKSDAGTRSHSESLPFISYRIEHWIEDAEDLAQDAANYTIRKITPAGAVTTIAGAVALPLPSVWKVKTAQFPFPAIIFLCGKRRQRLQAAVCCGLCCGLEFSSC